jgi:hypothetical protein
MEGFVVAEPWAPSLSEVGDASLARWIALMSIISGLKKWNCLRRTRSKMAQKGLVTILIAPTLLEAKNLTGLLDFLLRRRSPSSCGVVNRRL